MKQLPPFDHRASSKNQISHFENLVMQKFWENFKPTVPIDQETYFHLNRAISDALNQCLFTIQVEYVISRDMKQHIKIDDIDGMAQYQMAQQLSEELVQSDCVFSGKKETMMGDTVYYVDLPIIGWKGIKE